MKVKEDTMFNIRFITEDVARRFAAKLTSGGGFIHQRPGYVMERIVPVTVHAVTPVQLYVQGFVRLVPDRRLYDLLAHVLRRSAIIEQVFIKHDGDDVLKPLFPEREAA